VGPLCCRAVGTDGTFRTGTRPGNAPDPDFPRPLVTRRYYRRMPSALYDRVGAAYDATRRADSYIVSRLLAHLGSAARGWCLDVACGTGNYTLALAAAGVPVVGVDASERMITAAARKAPALGDLEPMMQRREPAGAGMPLWAAADVTRLPFRSTSFSGATCTLALRYFADLDAAIAELGRVVGDGPLVLFAATPDQIRRYWLRLYFPETIERTAAQAHSMAHIRRALETAGFPRVATEVYTVRADLQDLFLYSGKYRPALYLNPAVRAGMWSFATLAPPGEETAGCDRLRRDVQSGQIAAAIRGADDSEGDYVFVVARR
jgi:ubiquinone/menaquinone biosynthesis C-methylase UbiE